ncbi:bifunctional helix-turn-helix transcriptional regulator/GNAT family N-acetyltransferase [Anaerobacillus isosaccharinicus]|uniref:MarR family transcriptional regulator n=1 Tax=Anaerobacillus isosaccharinicus TaxID=1532552 RepID=A0A1S2MEY0_9BACI|nr:helix-turn-helix domain-containing GNAT family N-acetyltransferase [Anaerobacillus isosaccharinicus]MBA5586501.1 MarR family transcriptional regulator [Anaerobacillus isosaccharinicus]QOY35258.1 MarR family transcriptional regulator [Anaerobacillus isosaccharinicus]
MQSTSSSVFEVRKFNRFYTNVLGLLKQQLYDSPLSLTEIRILFEIKSTSNCTAKVLQEELGLDSGYVSRILNRFEEQNMICKKKCKKDGRTYIIHLTETGEKLYQDLDNESNRHIEFLLRNIDISNQQKLIEAMKTIEMILSENLKQTETLISIRDNYTAEDKELIIEKQRAFYADNFGFDETFLGYLHETFEANIEKIWIAEVNGEFAGCIGLVEKNEKIAQLRWFFVEPLIRGKKVGTQLIRTLLDYCVEKKYEQISLETISKLTTARRLYSKFGFELIEAKEQFIWGQEILDEQWNLKLI